MKTLGLMLILMGAALLGTAPTASACDVSSPVVQGALCIAQYEDGWGDQTCEEVGYHKEGAYAIAKVPGVGGAIVNAWQYCYQGSALQYDGTWVLVTVWIIDTADVFIMHSNWEGTDSGCFVIIVADTAATGPYSNRIDCNLPA